MMIMMMIMMIIIIKFGENVFFITLVFWMP